MKSDELNIDEVNSALMQVKGLGIPEATALAHKPSQNNKTIDPKSLQIEDTNNLVGGILGGDLKEQLDPKVPIYEGRKTVVQEKSVFEKVLARHIESFAECKNFAEFKASLNEFRDDLKSVKKKDLGRVLKRYVERLGLKVVKAKENNDRKDYLVSYKDRDDLRKLKIIVSGLAEQYGKLYLLLMNNRSDRRKTPLGDELPDEGRYVVVRTA